VKHGQAALAASLVAGGADVHTTLKGGFTPLIVATALGHVAVMEVLLGAGAGGAHQAGCSPLLSLRLPLYIAVFLGNTAAAQVLLRAGADVNMAMGEVGAMFPDVFGHCNQLGAHSDTLVSNDGTTTPLLSTPLWISVARGRVAMVVALLAAGADANVPSSDGQTPLFMALRGGHDAVVMVLLGAGADPDLSEMIGAVHGRDIPDEKPRLGEKLRGTRTGMTPLLWAVHGGQATIVTALLGAGADANKAEDVLDEKPRLGEKLRGTRTGMTPLLWAVHGGQATIVTALLGAGADANKTENNGMTPLALAAHLGDGASVTALTNGGADVNLTVRDYTPLCMAVQGGHVAAVTALLGAGADPNKTALTGATPLISAACKGDGAVVTALIRGGAKVDLGVYRDGNLVTPLLMAASKGHDAAVKALLQAGASVVFDSTHDEDDPTTPISVAAYDGHEEVLKMLLQAGVDVNHARDGEAAMLVRAVKNGNHAVVAVLYAWTLARDDPVQRYFLRFTDLPTTLPITDPSGCSLAQLPTEVLQTILSSPPSCRLLSHQVRCFSTCAAV
jgi:ankyrin repeat protein